MDSVGPGDPVRRRRHHHGVSDDHRIGCRLHPERLGVGHRLRRGRRTGGQGAHRKPALPEGGGGLRRRCHQRHRTLPRRPGGHPGRRGRAGARPAGRRAGRRRSTHRRLRSGGSRHPDLHLGHHRPPEGCATGPRQLDVRGHGRRRAGHPRTGRRAVPVAADVARAGQGALGGSTGIRLRHRGRRGPDEDRGEPGSGQADLHGWRPPDLREGQGAGSLSPRRDTAG